MRKCEIKNINCEDETFKLVFCINGEIKKEKEEFCIEDLMLDCYDFLAKCKKEFLIDTRSDEFTINFSLRF